jgi:hypothetical protein
VIEARDNSFRKAATADSKKQRCDNGGHNRNSVQRALKHLEKGFPRRPKDRIEAHDRKVQLSKLQDARSQPKLTEKHIVIAAAGKVDDRCEDGQDRR